MFRKVNESLKELKQICQKKTDPFDEKLYKHYRRFSIYVTKIGLRLGLSANQVTLISIFFGINAGLFMTRGNPWLFGLGALVYHIYCVFDCADGEVARYRKESSVRGAYLDNLVGDFIPLFIFGCAAFGIYEVIHHLWTFAFGFSLLFSIVLREVSIKSWSIAMLQTNSHDTKSRATSIYETAERLPLFLRHLRRAAYVFSARTIINALLISSVLDAVNVRILGFPSSSFCWRAIVYFFYGALMPILTIAGIGYILYRGKILKVTPFVDK